MLNVFRLDCFPGWTIIKNFPQDASPRRYYRAEKNGRSAIIMDAQHLDPQEFRDFIGVGQWLRLLDLRAPEIYAAQEEKQIILLEDFGDLSMKQALLQGADAMDLYGKARDILRCLAQNIPPHPMPAASSLPPAGGGLGWGGSLPLYEQTRVHEWRRLVVDYYLPAVTHKIAAPDLVQQFLDLWVSIEKTLPPCPRGFLHMDFHVENLMVLPDGTLGILDFQTAAIGPLGYDMGNLAFDMRHDVPAPVQQFLLQSCDAALRPWVRILATQFHGRLLGQCVRWALREGKPQYLQYIPRLENYMRDALKEPLFAPLKAFFDKLDLDFQGLGAIKPERLRPLIATDAP
ncbi:MAG: phosphotransferase [Alphaproteobacteria bacterium]|nr:phosphotransferase [Alphaproteobacteria bacterium]